MPKFWKFLRLFSLPKWLHLHPVIRTKVHTQSDKRFICENVTLNWHHPTRVADTAANYSIEFQTTKPCTEQHTLDLNWGKMFSILGILGTFLTCVREINTNSHPQDFFFQVHKIRLFDKFWAYCEGNGMWGRFLLFLGSKLEFFYYIICFQGLKSPFLLRAKQQHQVSVFVFGFAFMHKMRGLHQEVQKVTLKPAHKGKEASKC